MTISPLASGETETRKALEAAWTDFLDANPDDLTSPEDLPDHALMTFEQFARYALAALASEDMQGWRTMDSAPKDGTRIQLWHRSPAQHDGHPVYGSWREYQPGVKSWRTDTGAPIKATHWQPAPPAPETRT